MGMAAKMLKIQNGLKAPKNQYNDYGGYAYRSCEDIVNALKPLLAGENLFMYISDSVEQIGDRYYIKATVSLTDCESGEKLENTAFAREPVARKGMDESQITGTASSYARKYALNGLFCIDDCKDADTNECAKESENNPVAVYNCQKCGQVVKGFKRSDGTAVSAAETYSKTGGLCVKCANEVKKNAAATVSG